MGEENSKHLKKHLFQNKKFSEFLSTDLVESFYDKFLNEDVKYSHSVNMLLVLSMFCKNDQFKNQPL
ncbi:MAG: hypothetical protein R3A12_03745 [Ignavibacteria bacterium]